MEDDKSSAPSSSSSSSTNTEVSDVAKNTNMPNTEIDRSIHSPSPTGKERMRRIVNGNGITDDIKDLSPTFALQLAESGQVPMNRILDNVNFGQKTEATTTTTTTTAKPASFSIVPPHPIPTNNESDVTTKIPSKMTATPIPSPRTPNSGRASPRSQNGAKVGLQLSKNFFSHSPKKSVPAPITNQPDTTHEVDLKESKIALKEDDAKSLMEKKEEVKNESEKSTSSSSTNETKPSPSTTEKITTLQPEPKIDTLSSSVLAKDAPTQPSITPSSTLPKNNSTRPFIFSRRKPAISEKDLSEPVVDKTTPTTTTLSPPEKVETKPNIPPISSSVSETVPPQSVKLSIRTLSTDETATVPLLKTSRISTDDIKKKTLITSDGGGDLFDFDKDFSNGSSLSDTASSASLSLPTTSNSPFTADLSENFLDTNRRHSLESSVHATGFDSQRLDFSLLSKSKSKLEANADGVDSKHDGHRPTEGSIFAIPFTSAFERPRIHTNISEYSAVFEDNIKPVVPMSKNQVRRSDDSEKIGQNGESVEDIDADAMAAGDTASTFANLSDRFKLKTEEEEEEKETEDDDPYRELLDAISYDALFGKKSNIHLPFGHTKTSSFSSTRPADAFKNPKTLQGNVNDDEDDDNDPYLPHMKYIKEKNNMSWWRCVMVRSDALKDENIEEKIQKRLNEDQQYNELADQFDEATRKHFLYVEQVCVENIYFPEEEEAMVAKMKHYENDVKKLLQIIAKYEEDFQNRVRLIYQTRHDNIMTLRNCYLLMMKRFKFVTDFSDDRDYKELDEALFAYNVKMALIITKTVKSFDEDPEKVVPAFILEFIKRSVEREMAAERGESYEQENDSAQEDNEEEYHP